MQNTTLPTPAEIRAHLDEYVIGQEDAKKVLAVAVYNHYKRINYSAAEGGIELKKSNIMMIGPTGSGKTLLASTLARCLGVPYAGADATALIGATGGINAVLEGMLLKLVQNAGNDIRRAEKGIIYIDEIDKIAKRFNNQGGEGIQQALLKVIEGSEIHLPEYGMIDTHDILFIVGGAFVGLEIIIQTRQSGFGIVQHGGQEENKLIQDIMPGDLAKFGLIPEFIGRIPVVVGLSALDRQALIDVLTKPKNAIINQYKTMFALDKINLVFSQESLEKIADKAIELKTGARGLRSIVEDRMRDIMYNAPSERNLNKVIIGSDVIDKSGEAAFEYVHAKEDIEVPEAPEKKSRTKTAQV